MTVEIHEFLARAQSAYILIRDSVRCSPKMHYIADRSIIEIMFRFGKLFQHAAVGFIYTVNLLMFRYTCSNFLSCSLNYYFELLYTVNNYFTCYRVYTYMTLFLEVDVLSFPITNLMFYFFCCEKRFTFTK